MRVLVTGINGFVGRYTATRLSEYGHAVAGLGNSENCTVPKSNYFCTKLGQIESINALCEQIGCLDAIVHLAANLSMSFDDDSIIQDNVQGMQDILHIAELTQVRQIVYMSSIMVYGKPQFEPIDETHPLNPPTLYHCTKLFGEYLLKVYLGKHPECIGTVFRMASPIGVGMRKNFMPTILEQARHGKDIVLYGHGKRMQNYIDVRDVAEMIAASLSDKPNGTFNLGGMKSYSNLQVAEYCKRICNSQSKICFQGDDPQEAERWVLDIKLLKDKIGYEAQYDLEDTIRWMLKGNLA